MKNIITKIMIALTAVAMLIGMSSCYTARTAQRQIDKAHYKHPQVPAKFCSERYPPTDSVSVVKEYIQGEDLVFTDTVVDLQRLSDTITAIKYITRTVRTTDTFRDTRYVQQENKASIVLKNVTIKNLDEQIVLLSEGRKNWRWAALTMGSILAALILYKIARLYFKIK